MSLKAECWLLELKKLASKEKKHKAKGHPQWEGPGTRLMSVGTQECAHTCTHMQARTYVASKSKQKQTKERKKEKKQRSREKNMIETWHRFGEEEEKEDRKGENDGESTGLGVRDLHSEPDSAWFIWFKEIWAWASFLASLDFGFFFPWVGVIFPSQLIS